MRDLVIIITGASSGIGAALARDAVARGAKVVLAARREAELTALATALGPNALAVVTDVAVRADTVRLCERAIAAFGHVDAFVANAGRGISRPVLALEDTDLDDMMTINVKSMLHAAQAIVPHFIARERGHFIYVSSGLARMPFAPIRSAYSAAKAAASSLMTSLRMELRPHPQIRVSTLFPGIVATDFGTNARHGGPDSRQLPGAQPVEEVAAILAELIATPRAEVYSRPQMKDAVARYYSADDVATLEVGMGPPPRP